MGDDSKLQTKGIGRIDLERGFFNEVLYVLDLEANFLSVYQMTHTGEPKRVIFTPDSVDISEISIDQVVAVGYNDHHERIYKFSNFLPTSSDQALNNHMPMRFPNYGMRGLATSITYISKHCTEKKWWKVFHKFSHLLEYVLDV